jgi:hypothetical protein
MASIISKILSPTNKIVPGIPVDELDKIPQNTSRKIPEGHVLKLTDKQYANFRGTQADLEQARREEENAWKGGKRTRRRKSQKKTRKPRKKSRRRV